METTKPDLHTIDPKGLIADAYAIEGITDAECRTIFLDWAISVPGGQDSVAVLPVLASHYADKDPAHPMSLVIAEGIEKAAAGAPKRRGGARARR